MKIRRFNESNDVVDPLMDVFDFKEKFKDKVMKYLKLFEGFSKKQNKIDDLLDKISKNGIESLTEYELDVLNNGGEEESDEYGVLAERILSNLENDFAISVDVANIPIFFKILNRQGIKTQSNIDWSKWGNKFYFMLIDGKLKHDHQEPKNVDIYIPTFPEN